MDRIESYFDLIRLNQKTIHRYRLSHQSCRYHRNRQIHRYRLSHQIQDRRCSFLLYQYWDLYNSYHQVRKDSMEKSDKNTHVQEYSLNHCYIRTMHLERSQKSRLML